MSKCERCGYEKPVNPLKPLLACIGHLIMLAFLNHSTPMQGSWGGAADFWINWHGAMWWWSAILAAICAVFFLIFTGAWMAGAESSHQRS